MCGIYNMLHYTQKHLFISAHRQKSHKLMLNTLEIYKPNTVENDKCV